MIKKNNASQKTINSVDLERYHEIAELGEEFARLGFYERNWQNGTGFWSEGFYKLLGVNSSEIDCTHEDFLTYIHPDDVVRVEKHVRTSLKEKTTMDVEFKLVQKNGQIIHIHGTGKNFYDSDGRPLKTIGTFMDISERKRADKAIEESEAKLRSYIDNAPDGIFVVDEKGRYLELNAAACKITGYSEKELLSMKIPDLLQEAEVDKGLQHFEEVKLKGSAIGEIGFITKNGDERYWQIAGVKLSDTRILGFAKDVTDVRITLDELKKQNTFIQMILDNFPIGIATNEIDTQKVNYINPKFAEIYGWDKEEFPTTIKFFEKVFPDPEKRAKFQKEITEDIASGDPERMNWEDLEITTQSGEKRLVHAFNIPLFEQNIMVSTVQDITEKRKAERERKESENKLKSIIENSTNMFYAHSVEHEITFVSQQVREYLGCEPEEAMKNWMDFATDNPINEAGYRSTLKALKTGERQDTYELELRRVDGRKILVEVREAPVVEQGKVVGIVGSLVDITERKKNEEAFKKYNRELEASEILLKTIINATPDLVWLKDKEGIYLNCNKRFEDFFGHLEGDIIGKTDYDFVDKELADFFREHDRKAMEAGKPTINEEEITFANDGHKEVLETIKTPVRNKNGDNIGVLGVGRDITLRKKAEEELISAKERAEEADHLKSAFLANMSHEIRTPMNGILGFTSLLENSKLSEQTREYYIDIIQKSGRRMLDTVNDLINISKLETGQEILNLENSIPCDLMRDICEFFKPIAEEKGLQFSFIEENPQKHQVRIDIVKFNAIARNLIKNAIKFTDHGSICVITQKKDDKFTFIVKDTGRGIKQDRQAAVFDRFVQENINGINAYEGSGLGLSIVKSYIDMMGGKIELESEEGKGSSFYVEIPLLQSREILSSNEIITNDHAELKLTKVLIAEDDDISYQLLSIGLTPYTKTILRAENGKEAIELLKSHEDIELILMDLKMPIMDGLEATRRIREFNKKISIISQTAYALQGDEKKSYEAGCNAFISKPVEINKLLNIISGLQGA